jgi:hypothetical protein
MGAVPAETPVAKPEDTFIDATPAFPLDHVPPTFGLVSTADEPTQRFKLPPMVPGKGLTVTVVSARQPVGNV